MMLGMPISFFKRVRKQIFDASIARLRGKASWKERQIMLHAISLAVLTTLAAPSHAPQAPDSIILAQQQQAPQQTPKRDCERKREEGVSS